LHERVETDESAGLPRVLVAIAIAYALSPIDLIPDFIPVLGLLDDLVLVPALLALAIRYLPPAFERKYELRSGLTTNCLAKEPMLRQRP